MTKVNFAPGVSYEFLQVLMDLHLGEEEGRNFVWLNGVYFTRKKRSIKSKYRRKTANTPHSAATRKSTLIKSNNPLLGHSFSVHVRMNVFDISNRGNK